MPSDETWAKFFATMQEVARCQKQALELLLKLTEMNRKALDDLRRIRQFTDN